MPVREFRFFVVGVTIQLDTGGNLVDLLAALSLLLRRRNQMHLKVRALSSEARASAWILGALPVVAGIAIWVLNPGYLATFLHDQRGRVIAFAGVMSLVAGAFTMARMTKLRS